MLVPVVLMLNTQSTLYLRRCWGLRRSQTSRVCKSKGSTVKVLTGVGQGAQVVGRVAQVVMALSFWVVANIVRGLANTNTGSLSKFHCFLILYHDLLAMSSAFVGFGLEWSVKVVWARAGLWSLVLICGGCYEFWGFVTV